jgi:predicted RNase H-like HicB family nuclease
MTTAVDNWPAYARLLAVASAGQLPTAPTPLGGTQPPYEIGPQPEGGFTVVFPDVPEAITEGDTEAEAHERAEDPLVTALSFYTDASRPLPVPSPARGRPPAIVPALEAAKLALHEIDADRGDHQRGTRPPSRCG